MPKRGVTTFKGRAETKATGAVVRRKVKLRARPRGEEP